MSGITLGSLFDGISGFPLAGERVGITAKWASEIEPFPMRVSAIYFPGMEQKGDITKLNGAELEPVDIITGGSPCQDLSVAGKHAGLAGERSGLFVEQIRIVREMRNADNGKTNQFIRPRFMVWENVPGAFSSNKGEDFRAVLEETARIADETVIIPGPAKGKWSTVGCIMGDGWSIAWRILDAQYWGVPQRRRRIFLVADFGGQSAPEILFKREGLSRHLAEGGEAREGIAADAEGGFRETGQGYWGEGIGCLRAEGENRPSRPSNVIVQGFEGNVARTLTARHDSSPCADRGQNVVAVAIDSNCQDSRFRLTSGIVSTLPAKAGTGGNNDPMLAIPINDKATRYMGGGLFRNQDGSGNGLGVGKPGDPCPTLTQRDKHSVAVLPFNATQITSPANGNNPQYGDPCHPLCATDYAPHIVQKVIDETAHPLSAQPQMRHRLDMDNVVMTVAGCDFRNDKENGDLCGTLQAKPTGGQSLNCIHPVRIGYSVRRLTPLECERLQDYEDRWTDIPGASDSGRYKALGNSVAVCCPEYVLEGISEILTKGG